MPSYLLLRNNKESGPYSLNDLIELGLKPYDLVWVESRSAAWRYPSEIAELKEYAPIVEEQPFDRFFKKPSDTATREEIIPEKKIIREEPVKNIPVKNIITETNNIPPSYQPEPHKKVFVSMPEKNNSLNPYKQYLPKTAQEELPKTVEQRSYSPIDIHESEETRVETKYAQSLDEIKEMYVNTLVQRKTRNRRKELVKKYLKPVLAALFLLISGAAIGYVLTSKKATVQAAQGISTIIPEQKAAEINKTENKIVQPEEKQITVPEPENKNKYIKTEELLIPKQKTQQKNTVSKTNIQTALKTPEKKNNRSTFIPDDESVKVPKQDVEIDPQTGERRKAVRHDDQDETVTSLKDQNTPERAVRNSTIAEPKSLNKLVSIKTNNYIRGTFGGIKDLRLTVSNDSKYFVDEVKVELQYIKPSQLPLRTDIITFRNLSPNGSVTVRVPDSQRGIRVDYRITRVQSHEWQKSTAGL